MKTTTSAHSTKAEDLQIFLDVVHLVNTHHDEDALIEAVLNLLEGMNASGGMVFRRFEADQQLLVPAWSHLVDASPDGLPPAEAAGIKRLLNELAISAEGSFEGHCLRTNSTMVINDNQIPDVPLSKEYVAIVEQIRKLDVNEALLFAAKTEVPIGVLALYSMGDVLVETRRVQLLERAAQVLAFGIEKCRVLKQVSDQHVELEAATGRLIESNRDLEDFAHVASHDLQEPLRKIQAFGDRLETKAGDRLTGESLHNLKRMRHASHRMQVLVNDLLRFSRVNSKSIHPEPVDIAVLVNEAVAAHARGLEQVEGALTIATDLPALTVDGGQFEQLFSALVENAIKYRQPGKRLEIEIAADDRDELWHRISVRDNGIGFEERFAQKVFEPFQRLHSSAEYEGSGMGLAICRRILERHNGSITVESKLGEGSLFNIWLPKNAESSA